MLGAGDSPVPASPAGLCLWRAESCQFCPAGWMGDAGRCYYFSSAKKSWEQSKDDCCSRGAQLATARANSTLVSPSACPGHPDPPVVINSH